MCWGSFSLTQDCPKDLSASHVLLCDAGRPKFFSPENPYIVHSSNTISASPFIIFSGLRMSRQTSYEFVVRLKAMSRKKPNRCKNNQPEFASNANQPSSTVISLFSNLIVTKVPVAILMLLTLHCWATPPVFTITNAPTLGVLVSRKDGFGAAASLSSKDFAHGADTGQRESSTHIQRSLSSVLVDQYTGIE